MKLCRGIMVLMAVCCVRTYAGAEEIKYPAATITPEMKSHAHAVIRREETHIQIVSPDEMITHELHAVTILDEKGADEWSDIAAPYLSASDNVRSIHGVIYDENGRQIRKIRESDFNDISSE